MARYARRTTLYSFAFFLLLAAPVLVYAGGGNDADLARADRLIEERNYDEAMQILTDYARRNPDNFEYTYRRLSRISQLKEEFTSTADELINTLLEEPDNSERILELTIKLRSLENDSSPVLASFITRTQEIAQFNVYRNRLRDILERGRMLLDNEEGGRALAVYAGAMGFMRDEFFSLGYGSAIETSVTQETNRMNSAIAAFSEADSNIHRLSLEMIEAVNSGIFQRAGEITERLIPAMDRFIWLKRELYTAVGIFDDLLAELQETDPEMGDRSHLSFLSIVIHGRSNESIQEGMLGAFDTSWNASVTQVLNAICANAESNAASALAAFNTGNYSGVTAYTAMAEQYIGLASLFLDKNRMLNETKDRRTLLLFEHNILQDDIPSFINIMSLSEAIVYLRQASILAERMNVYNNEQTALEAWQAGSINTISALDTEMQTRNNIAIINGEIERIIISANEADALINSAHNTENIRAVINAIENYHSFVITEEQKAAARYYAIANGDLSVSLAARREELERGRTFLEGTRNENDTAIDRYPAEALMEFTAMISALENNIERGSLLLAGYAEETSLFITHNEILELQAVSREIVSELNNIHAQGIALSETARSRSALAETYRQEGDRMSREAQAAFARQDFDTARDRIQRASERYNSSYEIQASVSLRRAWDSQLVSLGQAISAAENEMIIVEVRNLVNISRNLYFAGDFQQAENNLLRARSRWRTTNPGENEEVVYWLGIVRGAMSARSGRIIPPTAPLYPEMSQLLSEAAKNFEEGVQLMNSGSRSHGLTRFDYAQQLIQEVKLIFPLNQEAGILELRIEQYRDPVAFNASFGQKLNDAILGTTQRSMESFADLQNLAEINPRYIDSRGWSINSIITQAEINMGFRPPPPNPADLARSRDLTASANRILTENNTMLFEAALMQINEAIALNPENTQAAAVKDRLLSRMSVPDTIVMTSQDEAEYQRAVRELQAGNNLIALAVVERLLQNPRNRNITKLIELQQRIQSIL